jgi:hypothetical protein
MILQMQMHKSAIKIVQYFAVTSVSSVSCPWNEACDPIIVDKSKTVQKIQQGIEQFEGLMEVTDSFAAVHS